MNRASGATQTVGPEEIERRIAEYRRLAFEHRSPAVMVYPAEQHPCPWPGCEVRIAGIDFHLEQMGNLNQRQRWHACWWQGPGLVGKCPECGRYVLFGYGVKKAVTDVNAFPDALLPEDWSEKAHIAPRPQNCELGPLNNTA